MVYCWCCFMPVSLHMELKFYREGSRKIIKDIKLPNAEVILVPYFLINFIMYLCARGHRNYCFYRYRTGCRTIGRVDKAKSLSPRLQGADGMIGWL